jgi:hypothetical protein
MSTEPHESFEMARPDQEQLLQHSHTTGAGIARYSSISESPNEDEEAPLIDSSNILDQSVENDVLPETAVLGRNLRWNSA